MSVLAASLLKKDILFIVGPTAVGKSALAVWAALEYNAEIINGDSMQVYREPRIISDKPSLDERRQVLHHLMDIVSVKEDFNAARFCDLAKAAIEDILSRGRKVIVCGGTGMYMNLLLDGISQTGARNDVLRAQLEERCVHEGLAGLYDQLTSVDPDSAERINANDPVRIIRALEVFLTTGVPLSRACQERTGGIWGKYAIEVVGLVRPREVLYKRAEERVEAMFDKGAVEEVRYLLTLDPQGSAARMIGLPEISGHLSGAYSQAHAKALMKKNTRHYIKRQLTWFRKDPRITWVSIPHV